MNFLRVVRMALRYKYTFIAAVCSALIVAVFWGANIGALYPIVEMVFQNQSAQQWLEEKIRVTESSLTAKRAELERFRERLANADEQEQRKLHWESAELEARAAAEAKALAGYRFIKPYVERYLPDSPFRMLVVVTLLLLLGTVIKDVFLVANNVLVARLAQLATFDLRKLFYRRTLRLDLAAFGEEGTADLMSRFTNDMQQVAGGLESLFGKLVREPLKMFACLGMAAFICWRLLLLTMLVAPPAVYLVRWLARMLKKANRRAMEEMAAIYATLEETFRAIKIVKAFTNEPRVRRRFHQDNKRYYRRAMRIAAYDSLTHPLTEVLGIATISLAMLAGSWLILSQQTHLFGVRMSARPLDRGALLLFFALLAGVADPLRKMSDIFSRLQAAAAAADRIFARLDRRPRVRDPIQPASFHRHHRDLRFENVSFSYVPGKPVLERVNLHVNFGETLAIVGPNGSGKSTLTDLILRFADPDEGDIKLDGISLKDIRLNDLRSQIGLVAQETVLFEDSIFNNIRYGNPQAAPEEVIEAAKQAHAHRFIEQELPQGYQTPVGALGNRLSGGQRQRIALARAILRNPALLILDEATSQVDLESEQAIQEVLEKFTRNRTTILVTHKPTLLSLADRIAVMQQGRILDVGRHEELLARCAFYRRLHQIHYEDLRQSA